jgi:cell shape-determining protein MreD
MLMPALSVTALGVIAAAAVSVHLRSAHVRVFAAGFLGSWAGFLCGAVAGLLVDVLTGGGVFLAVFGHTAALVGAVAAARRTAAQSRVT